MAQYIPTHSQSLEHNLHDRVKPHDKGRQCWPSARFCWACRLLPPVPPSTTVSPAAALASKSLVFPDILVSCNEEVKYCCEDGLDRQLIEWEWCLDELLSLMLINHRCEVYIEQEWRLVGRRKQVHVEGQRSGHVGATALARTARVRGRTSTCGKDKCPLF